MLTTLLCRLFGCNKPGGPHYYLALLQPLDSNAKGITLTLISTTFLQLIWINIEEISNEAEYWRQQLNTGIRKASIFDSLPHILELPTCFPRDIMHQPVITGDKDPYTQWAHGEYIVGTDNTWPQCTQQLKIGYTLNVFYNGSTMCPMVKNWAHSECLLLLWPKCACWLQTTPILNDHPNVTTICGPITGWSHFECTQHWDHLALLAEHVDSIQNMLPEVSQMCLVITLRMYLKCNPFSGLYSECCCTSQCV